MVSETPIFTELVIEYNQAGRDIPWYHCVKPSGTVAELSGQVLGASFTGPSVTMEITDLDTNMITTLFGVKLDWTTQNEGPYDKGAESLDEVSDKVKKRYNLYG
jgi:hypothetical protein